MGAEKAHLRTELTEGAYRMDPLSRVTPKDSQDIDLWSAGDALVLKALAMAPAKHLPV